MSIAAILGIYQGIGLTGSQFSWLGSMFYLGYLIYQIPNQFFTQWFPIGRYLSVCYNLWCCATLYCTLSHILAIGGIAIPPWNVRSSLFTMHLHDNRQSISTTGTCVLFQRGDYV